MPVVVVVESFPVSERVCAVAAVGRSVQDEVKFFGDGADALQGAAQERAEVVEASGARESGAFERGFVGSRQEPDFVGHARRVGADGNIVAAGFEDAEVLAFFLREDVAEHAAFFGLEVVASGSEFVEHAARNEGGGRQLKVGVIEFLSGGRAVVFKDADVFEALVFFEVLDALRDQSQELLDGGVGRVPELTVVVWAFEQDFVGADWTHAVVESIAASVRIAFDAIQGVGMNDGARGPLSVVA